VLLVLRKSNTHPSTEPILFLTREGLNQDYTADH